MVERIEQNYNQETQANQLDSELELLDMVTTSLQKKLEKHPKDQMEEAPAVPDHERSEYREDHLKINQYPLSNSVFERFPFLHDLPQGVAVMGGVARSVAREMLTGDLEPIRDIDLVNITTHQGKTPISIEELIALSEKYMPEDFAFGHGIRDESFDHYFQTRDFTINQSLVLNNHLYVSEIAQNDFIENIIRPTYYELPRTDDFLSSRLFLKALMMKTVLSQVTSSIPLIEDIDRTEYVETFDIALTLNKTMSRGVEVAREFTADLVDWGLLSQDYLNRPLAAAKALRSELYNFNFYPSGYQNNHDEENDLQTTNGQSNSVEFREFSLPDSMFAYHSTNPQISQAISEYGESPITGLHATTSEAQLSYVEPEYGQYSSSDYDYVNADEDFDGF